MSKFKDAINTWWGLAFTIVGGAAGCLSLPPAFSNTWRVVIFVGLLVCYVLGFLNGSKKTRKEMELEKERAVEAERSNTKALEEGLRVKTEQYERDVNRLNEQHEHERSELIAKHNAEADMMSHRHTQAMLGKDSEIDGLKDEISLLESQIAAKDATIQREREKSAELAARWEELNSEERRKREVFDTLNEREKWCLSHIVDDWPKKHSASGSLLLPSYGVLVIAGILVDQGTEELNGQTVHVYTIALEWRKWVFDHADELPEPDLTLPT